MFILTQGPNFETDDKSKTWISALRERLFSPAVEVRQKGDYSLALNGNFIIYSKNYDKCQKSIWKRDLQDFKLIEGDKFVYLDFWGTDRYLLLTKMGNIFIDGLVLHNVKAVVSSSTKTLLSSVDTHGIKLLDQCVPENFNDILEAKLENDCLLVKSADGSTFCFLESEEKELIDFYAGLGEFDKAIQVSKALLLDYQLLLKAKWKSSYAQKYLSIETLTEITDKRWVLEACICDLPDTTPKIRDLLKFGLSLTDHLSAAIIESELEKILDGTKDTYEEISPLEFYSYRLKFLTGLDRLNTFEGLHSSEISFGKSKSKKFSIVTEFKKFWTVDILEFAAQMSFRGEASKLELLFTRHGSSLLKYRLFLLDLLPLIMDPSKYGMLLPKMRGDKTIPWNEIPWRRPDWSESKNLKELESMLNDLPSPLPSNEFPEPANVVLKWFENRILELESVAGQPSLAHELALLGIQNGIDLNQVTTNMQLISSINQFGAQVTLEEFELLSVYEKLNLLLEGCGLQDVSKLLLNDVFPYFNRLKVDYQFDLFEVLRKKIKHDPAYLVQIIEVLIQSNMEKVLEDLIHTAAFEDEILTCDYEFWSRVTLLLNKITPIHTDSVNIVGEESGWDDADFDVNFEIESAKPNQLPEYVDALQLMVNAGVFFQSHGILLKIGQVKLLKEEKGKSFVAKLLRQSKFLLSADDIQWQITLRSLLNFNDCGLFSQLTTLDIYTEIVMMALNFSKFQFVQSIFYPKNGESVLSQSTIETLVLNAAIDFFDNDQEGDQNTGLMKLSRTCCSILPSSIPAIKTHLNLIDATHILITDFHLAIDSYSKIMPIQIRLHEDRVKLFKPLIDLHPDLYVKKSLVSDLKLKLLGSDSESARSKAFINVWTAKAALACQDEEAAFHLCLETLNIVENSSKLFDEILSEILDLLTIIRNKSTDDLGYAILVAKTLTASKGSSYNSIIEYWRNSLFRLAIGGLARDSISDDAETIYNTIEDMRLDFSKESEQVEADSENCHDFLKSVGSPVGDSYVLKSEFEGHLSLLETDLRCLKVQNSLFHAQDRFSQKNYGEHSYSIAKELFSTDSRLSIAYLLSCDVDRERLLKFFSCFDTSSGIFSIAAYFFSMKAILIMLNNPFCEVTESDCFQLSLDDAPTAAKRIFSAAQAVEFPGKDVVALYLDDASKLTERTMSSQKVKQREILVTLLHADEELINVDEKYRKKMILELSHSGAPKVINSCMELAILDGIDRAEVWLEHTRWLFQQDDYVITNVLDTTFPFITSNFNLIFTNILEIFKLASKKSDFATMTLYQAAIEANNSTKYLDDSDLEQLKLRVSIMQMLHSKKVKMPLNRLIDAKEHGLVKYLEIWKEFGLYMGLPNFLACLNSWIMLKPLTFLQEGFQLVQDSEHLLSKITSEVVYLHFASVASGLRDDIKAQSLLKEVASTFDHIFPLHLTDMISNILYCNTIPVGLRITLYAMAKPFLDNIDELLALNSHLNTIAKLQKYDFDGETVPSESCRLFEESFGNLDLAYQEITSLIRKGKPFLFVKFLCESFGFKPNEVYLYVVEKLLHSGDLDLLEKIVKSITAMQVQEEDFFEGWEIDDDLISSESNSTVFIVESILESIQLILKTYTLNSSTEHDKKMQIVTLLEREFVVQASDASKIQAAKVESIISNAWNMNRLEISDLGSDLASILNELTRITTNLRQAVSLVQVISYWPEENGPVTIDHWKFILHWTCENSFFEIILMIQLLRIDRGKLSSEAQLEIFNILKTKKSLLNHCFLYGLLSRDSDVREVTLQTFVTLHPDHRAYQITYRVLCCLGYYSKLPLSHQKECLLAVIQDRDRMCLLFVSMILSYRKFGSSVSVCKQWLEIPDGVIFGFKNWVQVERQILESAKQNWFAVIPKTLLEGDILASILSGPNDINKVFDIISLYLLAKEGKKALDDSLEAHYQLDPTSLTQFL